MSIQLIKPVPYMAFSSIVSTSSSLSLWQFINSFNRNTAAKYIAKVSDLTPKVKILPETWVIYPEVSLSLYQSAPN